MGISEPFDWNSHNIYELEFCLHCGKWTGRKVNRKLSLTCGRCGYGPMCDECYDNHAGRCLPPQPSGANYFLSLISEEDQDG